MSEETIGRYRILKEIAQGGMGQIFLVRDPVCKREIALKRIKEVYKDNKIIIRRFLKEARISSQLSHPGIIPIYAINMDPIYYTMPYVEGDNLKQILIKEKEEASIPSLMRIFLRVCETVSYVHSKGILHRDLKPENIVVGKYGEVLILDWGIASFVKEKRVDEEVEFFDEKADLTRPGKLAGTISCMAPERILGEEASYLTDIYSLGVMLYQILTLKLPFNRRSVELFKKNVKKEVLVESIERAPLRDIPLSLNRVVKKCLDPNKNLRYQTMGELMSDLRNYDEGRPEWILRDKLDVEKEDDWEFQENVLLAKHIAITREPTIAEWVSIMVSKRSFIGNIRLETEVKIDDGGRGIGFLVNVPDEKGFGEQGYSIWVGSSKHPISRLFRSNVLIKDFSEFVLDNGWHKILIEKLEGELTLYVDGKKIFSYCSHLPLSGGRIGILYKDGDFEMKKIVIHSNSYNVELSCLAVPDAFFNKKRYDDALSEYREIVRSFPGRKEGREAIFRSGITLVEKAKSQKSQKLKNLFLEASLSMFDKLHPTPGAPLEYLGKALAYKEWKDSREEEKCLELAIRKFPHHPLIPMIKEYVLYRLHESALEEREVAYRMILIAIRHIGDLLENGDTARLIKSLKEYLEPLYFIEEKGSFLAVQLAFWLAKKNCLLEILEESPENRDNVFFSLLELGLFDTTVIKDEFFKIACESTLEKSFDSFCKGSSSFGKKEERMLIHLLKRALVEEKVDLIDKAREKFPFENEFLQALWMERCLYDKNLTISFAKDVQEKSPLYFPYGLFLYLTAGKEEAFSFFGRLERAYPPTHALGGLYLVSQNRRWLEKCFFYEKRELYRQLFLYNHCVNNKEEEKQFKKLWKKSPIS